MLRRGSELIRLEEGRSGQDWILARQFCAFTLLDATAVPMARRKGFASMAIQRWSPFADTRFHIDWVGPRAMVWAWSNSQILDLGDNELATPPRRVGPESLYRGAPALDGAELVAMDEGVEGRVWREQALVASQWWATAPTLAEWNMLRRGAGLPADTAVPLPLEAPLAALPWTRQRVEAFNDLATRHRKTLLALAAGLAVALVAIPLASSIRIGVKTLMLQRVIDSESQGLRPTLDARENAERDLSKVRELLALRPPQRQLRLLAAVASATPGTGWTLLEWRMPDTHSLEVVLQMVAPDPTGIVRGWEGTGMFSNVSVDIGRTGNEVAIKADIQGPADVAAKASP
jgi:hypothetical protein